MNASTCFALAALLLAPHACLPAADTAGPELAALLESLGGELRLLACWYDGSRLAASRPFVAGEFRTPDTRWTSEIRTTPVAGEPGALDLAITFKLAEGMAKSAGVAVALDFADWSTNHYVLIPASVYNGNRNRIEYLSPGVRLLAAAVGAASGAKDALPSLLPIGLGAKAGELNKVYVDAFQRIVLRGEPIRETLAGQAKVLDGLMQETKAPCWAPDKPSAGPCPVN